MKSLHFLVVPLLFFGIAMVVQTEAATKRKPPQVNRDHVTCKNRRSFCFLKKVECPVQCPSVHPKDSKAKQCYLDCYSPKCEAVCRSRKPNCNGPGAACYDPRFIGGDGIVIYFHGKRNEHFSLISDFNLQVNAHFIGLRPVGRTRDFTWIRALGLMFTSHNLTLGATKAVNTWDDEVDHFAFAYDGQAVKLPVGHSSGWTSPDRSLVLERTSNRNIVKVEIPEVLEIFASIGPVIAKENMTHNYQIPSNDSSAHLEVQFRFFRLSSGVEGVLGRTYQPDFKNPAKPGVAMPVVGGDDKYKTSSLLSANYNYCLFNPRGILAAKSTKLMGYGTLDCSGGIGSGIVCKN